MNMGLIVFFDFRSVFHLEIQSSRPLEALFGPQMDTCHLPVLAALSDLTLSAVMGASCAFPESHLKASKMGPRFIAASDPGIG